MKNMLPPRTGRGTQRLKIHGKRVQNPRLQGKKVELPLLAYIDQAAGLEFLDVVRERGGRYSQRLAGVGTSERARGSRDSLKQFEALGIRQRLQDSGALDAREAKNRSCTAR